MSNFNDYFNLNNNLFESDLANDAFESSSSVFYENNDEFINESSNIDFNSYFDINSEENVVEEALTDNQKKWLKRAGIGLGTAAVLGGGAYYLYNKNNDEVIKIPEQKSEENHEEKKEEKSFGDELNGKAHGESPKTTEYGEKIIEVGGKAADAVVDAAKQAAGKTVEVAKNINKNFPENQEYSNSDLGINFSDHQKGLERVSGTIDAAQQAASDILNNIQNSEIAQNVDNYMRNAGKKLLIDPTTGETKTLYDGGSQILRNLENAGNSISNYIKSGVNYVKGNLPTDNILASQDAPLDYNSAVNGSAPTGNPSFFKPLSNMFSSIGTSGLRSATNSVATGKSENALNNG